MVSGHSKPCLKSLELRCKRRAVTGMFDKFLGFPLRGILKHPLESIGIFTKVMQQPCPIRLRGEDRVVRLSDLREASRKLRNVQQMIRKRLPAVRRGLAVAGRVGPEGLKLIHCHRIRSGEGGSRRRVQKAGARRPTANKRLVQELVEWENDPKLI